MRRMGGEITLKSTPRGIARTALPTREAHLGVVENSRVRCEVVTAGIKKSGIGLLEFGTDVTDLRQNRFTGEDNIVAMHAGGNL